MSAVLTPRKTATGWLLELPAEMAAVMKVAPGSFVVLYPKEGTIDLEVLPPPSDELLADFERMYEKYKDVCAELERLGD